MEWTQSINAYCERLDATFWAEPINAVTNAAFLLAALWMWPRCKGVPAARLLSAVLFAIGVGSFLFHTFATAWSSFADVVPIGLFILIYLFLANRDFVGLSTPASGFATALFLPYAAVVVFVTNLLPFFAISNFYWSVPLLLVLYGLYLRNIVPDTARGMMLGAALLCVSISVRSVDGTFCAQIPFGTHFVWHVLNGLMLGWMIEVYRRHQTHQRRGADKDIRQRA